MIGQSGIAVRNVKRADPDSVMELAKYGVATIHEAMGRVGLMAPYMRPIYPGAKACGTAVTIFAHPGDNWMLHVAAELLQKGDIAVLGTSSDNADGMFGDLLATSFRARGGIGLVIDAGTILNMPVFLGGLALGFCLPGLTWLKLRQANDPVAHPIATKLLSNSRTMIKFVLGYAIVIFLLNNIATLLMR